MPITSDLPVGRAAQALVSLSRALHTGVLARLRQRRTDVQQRVHHARGSMQGTQATTRAVQGRMQLRYVKHAHVYTFVRACVRAMPCMHVLVCANMYASVYDCICVSVHADLCVLLICKIVRIYPGYFVLHYKISSVTCSTEPAVPCIQDIVIS